MVNQCVVCRKTALVYPHLTFHRLPANERLRNDWCKLLKLEKDISKTSLVCSEHFSQEDIKIQPSGMRRLAKNVKPIPYEVEVTQRDILQEGQTESSTSTATDEEFEESRVDLASPAPKRLKYSGTVDEQTNLPGPSTLIARPSKEMSTSGSSANLSIMSGIETIGSSATVTASETEKELLKMQTDLPPDYLGPKSEYRGKLSLLKNKKRGRRAVGDITSDEFSTPTKRKVRAMKATIISQKMKVKRLQTTVQRLRTKITTLNAFVEHLRNKLHMSETSEAVIRSSLPGSVQDIFERMLRGPNRQKYTPSLRSFALTLSFYSPRAYNFVRNTFNKTLPHPTTICKWFQTVNGTPGFTQEALITLKIKVQEATKMGKSILCNLVLDEMSIRRQVEWTGNHSTGYINIGAEMEIHYLKLRKY